MRTHSKILLAGLTAALTLSIAVAGASANRLSVSTRTFTMTWASLTKTTTGGIGPIRCPFTMSGSFHSSTIAKVNGALIGHMNRASYNPAGCTGGRATINQEALPWHIRYRAFRGTLPNITGVDFGVIGAKITLEAAGLTCTNQSTATNPWVFVANLSAGRVTGVTPDSSATIPLRGSFLCSFAGNYTYSGTSSSVTALTITLI
jgi:hypothetical protein